MEHAPKRYLVRESTRGSNKPIRYKVRVKDEEEIGREVRQGLFYNEKSPDIIYKLTASSIK